MSAKLENQYGTISIENEVIARIAGLTAIDCYGIVGMAAKNVKDGFVQLLKRESLTIISTVKYKVETVCGIEVEQVNVFVEGVRVDG